MNSRSANAPRRTGPSGRREAILAAARAEFGARGVGGRSTGPLAPVLRGHRAGVELGLLIGLHVVYEAIRGLAAGIHDLAVRHAEAIIALERRLHVFDERAIQQVAVGATAGLLRQAAAARWGRRGSSFALPHRPERATERRSAWPEAAW
jgi:hypothetical protein